MICSVNVTRAVPVPPGFGALVGEKSQFRVGKSAARPSTVPNYRAFPGLFPIGTALEVGGLWIERWPADDPVKGRIKMSGQKLSHQLFAAFAALLMSSIAVGAAVAPEQVAAQSVKVISYV
jgi:hypothetical protein